MEISEQTFLQKDQQHREFYIYDAIANILTTAVQQGLQKNQDYSIYGAGTAYTLTTSAAAVVFGTTSPVLVIPQAGTYLINATVDLASAGATITNQTATIKLRRTNETAADITNGSLTLAIPPITTTTEFIGRFSLGPLIYTTANTDDSLTIFANLSGATGAGTITAPSGRIVAIKLY